MHGLNHNTCAMQWRNPEAKTWLMVTVQIEATRIPWGWCGEDLVSSV